MTAGVEKVSTMLSSALDTLTARIQQCSAVAVRSEKQTRAMVEMIVPP
jgi:hypothetical protein